MKEDPKLTFIGRLNSTSSNQQIKRELTWTDIFYMAAVDVTEDKFIQVTRYPLLDYLGIYFSKIHIISTRETIPMIVGDTVYPDYPKIDLKSSVSVLDRYFVDAAKIYPMYLPGIDGDFDGDQVTLKGIFSQEANKEANKIMYSKINILTTDGGIIRSIGNEGTQTLFTLTRFR